MKTTTRFFVKAAVLALVLSSAGFSYVKYKHSRTVALQQACKAENEAAVDKFKIFKKANPEVTGQLVPLICDPYELTYLTVKEPPYVPIGAEVPLMSAFKEEGNGVDGVLYGIAVFIAFIGVLPMAWYFLLARLSEVVAAVRRG